MRNMYSDRRKELTTFLLFLSRRGFEGVFTEGQHGGLSEVVSNAVVSIWSSDSLIGGIGSARGSDSACSWCTRSSDRCPVRPFLIFFSVVTLDTLREGNSEVGGWQRRKPEPDLDRFDGCVPFVPSGRSRFLLDIQGANKKTVNTSYYVSTTISTILYYDSLDYLLMLSRCH